jgi:hypothetical protein
MAHEEAAATTAAATVTDRGSIHTPGPFTKALDEQGVLQPGSEGWWQVAGARADDIRDGDLVMVKMLPHDGGPAIIAEYAVGTIIPEDGMLGTIFIKFTTPQGTEASFGRLCPVQVLRRGTHMTLADSVR